MASNPNTFVDPTSARVSTSPNPNNTADADDFNSIFDGSIRSPPNHNPDLGPDLENPFSRQNSPAPGEPASAPAPAPSTAPGGHNSQYPYPEVPSLYELMPDNPRLFYVPPQLQHLPVEQLRFPFNYIARGFHPTIPNVVSLETFSFFGIYYNQNVFTIADSLTDLRTVLQDIPDGFARWFPFAFQEQADWFVHGGCLAMECFTREDLDFYVQHHTRTNPFTRTTPPVNTPVKPRAPPFASSFTPIHSNSDFFDPSRTPSHSESDSFSLGNFSTPSTGTIPGPNPMNVPNNFPGFQPFPMPGAPSQGLHTGVSSNHQPFVSSFPYNPYGGNFGNPYIPGPHWFQQAPSGYRNILFKPTEIECPKWDGNTSTWHTMHQKLEVNLAQVNKSYLLNELSTNPSNAGDSKLFFKSMWKSFSGTALVPFTGQLHLFLNKGIEMYRELLAIYAPVDQETLLSLTNKLNKIKQGRNETILNYIKRIRLLSLSLIQNGQTWPESHLTLVAIQGLDSKRYGEALKAFQMGYRNANTLR